MHQAAAEEQNVCGARRKVDFFLLDRDEERLLIQQSVTWPLIEEKLVQAHLHARPRRDPADGTEQDGDEGPHPEPGTEVAARSVAVEERAQTGELEEAE